MLYCAGTVLKLGTKQHHDVLLGPIDRLDATGCFALTELGFGEPQLSSKCLLMLPDAPIIVDATMCSAQPEHAPLLDFVVFDPQAYLICGRLQYCMSFSCHPQAPMPSFRAGNNAVEMQTTATFDRAADEFIINTPTTLAQKYWITNGAVHAKWAVVFAQLTIGGRSEGIHGFLVRIRNEVRGRPPRML